MTNQSNGSNPNDRSSELTRLQNTKMPFGKYRGVRFDAIPFDYLDWVRGLNDLHEPLKTNVNAYLDHPTIVPLLEEALRSKRDG